MRNKIFLTIFIGYFLYSQWYSDYGITKVYGYEYTYEVPNKYRKLSMFPSWQAIPALFYFYFGAGNIYRVGGNMYTTNLILVINLKSLSNKITDDFSSIEFNAGKNVFDIANKAKHASDAKTATKSKDKFIEFLKADIAKGLKNKKIHSVANEQYICAYREKIYKSFRKKNNEFCQSNVNFITTFNPLKRSQVIQAQGFYFTHEKSICFKDEASSIPLDCSLVKHNNLNNHYYGAFYLDGLKVYFEKRKIDDYKIIAESLQKTQELFKSWRVKN